MDCKWRHAGLSAPPSCILGYCCIFATNSFIVSKASQILYSGFSLWGKGTTHCITEKFLWVKFLWKANSLHSSNVAIDYIRYARNTDFCQVAQYYSYKCTR